MAIINDSHARWVAWTSYAMGCVELFAVLWLPKILWLAKSKERSLGCLLAIASLSALVGSNVLLLAFLYPRPIVETLILLLPAGPVTLVCREALIVTFLTLVDYAILLVAKWRTKRVIVGCLVINVILAVSGLAERLIFHPGWPLL